MLMIVMKKPFSHFFLLVLISSFFILGLTIVSKVSPQFLFDREIASIQQSNVIALKALDTESIQKELNKKVKIYSISNDKVIALEGFSSQLCKSFSHVELVFEAYGVSVSGEPSQLKVSAECLPGQDPAEIATIRIPVAKLLKEQARNAQFKFSNYKETFELINSDEWAKTWILSQINFVSDNSKNIPSKTIKVSHDSLNDQSVVLDF